MGISLIRQGSEVSWDQLMLSPSCFCCCYMRWVLGVVVRSPAGGTQPTRTYQWIRLYSGPTNEGDRLIGQTYVEDPCLVLIGMSQYAQWRVYRRRRTRPQGFRLLPRFIWARLEPRARAQLGSSYPNFGKEGRLSRAVWNPEPCSTSPARSRRWSPHPSEGPARTPWRLGCRAGSPHA